MKKRQDGWVYVLCEEGIDQGPVKIGFANDVRERIKQLQAGNPRRLKLVVKVRGGTELEAFAHRCHRLDRVRRDGEWFEHSSDIKAFIESLREYESKGETPFARAPSNLDDEIECWLDPTWVQLRHIVHTTGRSHRARLKMPDRVLLEITRLASSGDEKCAAFVSAVVKNKGKG